MPKEIEKYKQLIKDYMTVFDSDEGKKVLKDLEGKCFIKRTTKVSNDALSTAYNEGRRSVILDIYSKRSMDEEKIKKLTQGGSDV